MLFRSKISIIPRGIGALGYTQQQPTEDRYLLKYGELLDRLDVLLGGRGAERLIFGELSTGAENDLQRATDLARQMVTRYGMSETLGPATFERARTALFLPEPVSANRAEYSERTAQEIDEEVRKLLGAAEERVRETLAQRRPELEALARALLQHEVIDRASLSAIIEAVRQSRAVPESHGSSAAPETSTDEMKSVSEVDRPAAAA